MALDFEDLLAENDRLSAEPGNSPFNNALEQFVKMPERNGNVTLRFLPPVLDNGKYKLYEGTRTHKINGKNLHCPKVLEKNNNPERPTRWVGECPICEYISWLWKQIDAAIKSGNEDLEKRLKAEASSIKAVERYYWPAIVRKEMQDDMSVKTNVGPKIYSCGKTVQAKIIRLMVGDKISGKAGLGDVTDPKTGRDFLVVKRTKSGPDSYPEYNDSEFLDVSPLGDPESVEKWIASRNGIPAFRKILSADELYFEVDVHRGKVVDTRNKKSRFDEEPVAPVGAAAAAVSREVHEEEVHAKPSPKAVEAVVTAPFVPTGTSTEDSSKAINEEDFKKMLQDL